MITTYLLQVNKPRSETGARPIPIFFGLFTVHTVKGKKRTIQKGTLSLSDAQSPRTYEVEMVGGMSSHVDILRVCTSAALATFGEEPCLAVRKRIARLAGDIEGEGTDIPSLLKPQGYLISIVHI